MVQYPIKHSNNKELDILEGLIGFIDSPAKKHEKGRQRAVIIFAYDVIGPVYVCGSVCFQATATLLSNGVVFVVLTSTSNILELSWVLCQELPTRKQERGR